MNRRLDRVGGMRMPLMIGAPGLALVADAARYFIRGQGFW